MVAGGSSVAVIGAGGSELGFGNVVWANAGEAKHPVSRSATTVPILMDLLRRFVFVPIPYRNQSRLVKVSTSAIPDFKEQSEC